MEPWRYEPAHDHELSAADRTRSLRRESGLVSTAGHLLWWSVVRGSLRIWHRLKVDGRENLPRKPPFVLVSNHSSHLDALVLGGLLPLRMCDRVFPVAAGDVFFETPAISWLAATFLNALPLWRKNCGSHALATLRERLLAEPCAYILFPEGTRSRDGKLQPFKSGLGMVVAGTPAPVVPCYLSGAFEALRPNWKIPRPVKITARVGPPLLFDQVTNDRHGWQHIAKELEAAVTNLQAR
jgi:1-acyl-sn-glycerol-3-phosphate acyltransferase